MNAYTTAHATTGHNNGPLMLDPVSPSGLVYLLQDALEAFRMVTSGEADAMAAWLLFGEALNAGRQHLPSDAQFGQWVAENLPDVEQKEREAAQWAARDRKAFEEFRIGNPRVRTVRGLHAKHKEAFKAAVEAALAGLTAEEVRSQVKKLKAQIKKIIPTVEHASTDSNARENARSELITLEAKLPILVAHVKHLEKREEVQRQAAEQKEEQRQKREKEEAKENDPTARKEVRDLVEEIMERLIWLAKDPDSHAAYLLKDAIEKTFGPTSKDLRGVLDSLQED